MAPKPAFQWYGIQKKVPDLKCYQDDIMIAVITNSNQSNLTYAKLIVILIIVLHA